MLTVNDFTGACLLLWYFKLVCTRTHTLRSQVYRHQCYYKGRILSELSPLHAFIAAIINVRVFTVLETPTKVKLVFGFIHRNY